MTEISTVACMEWRTDFENAPKDGRQILVFNGTEMAAVEYYQRKDGTAFWELGHSEGIRIYLKRPLTHWMPLPEPPKSEN